LVSAHSLRERRRYTANCSTGKTSFGVTWSGIDYSNAISSKFARNCLIKGIEGSFAG
jgi:hypothetical protein